MSGTASTPDDLLTVGRPLPRIAVVEPLDGFRVRATWSRGERAGTVETIDLAPAILSHRHFAPLRSDPNLFAAVRVNEDGNALEWGGGIELSAVWIEDLSNRAMAHGASQAMRFMKYRDANGRWRWSLLSANNRRLAESAEGYASEADCDAAIHLVRGSVSAPVIAA
jgi:uncharacterized protein YegP (UPF0339 family)